MSPHPLWASLLISGVNLPAAENSRPPNVLFIMTDQQRWDCLGANGNALIQTPHLDRLAARSANFAHAYVQSPVCVPSRVSFFTGRYAHAHKNRVNYTPLDPAETLLQARLKAAGYRTAVVGKLHYFPPTAEEARRTGFDVVELHDGVSATDRWSDYVKWRQQHDPKKGTYYPEGFAELYDLQTDPGERVNLAGRAEAHAVEAEMKDRLLRWLTTASETDQIAPRWRVYDPQK